MPPSGLKAEIEAKLKSSWFDIPTEASAEAAIDVVFTVIDYEIISAVVDSHDSAVTIVNLRANSVSVTLSCKLSLEVDVETTFVAGDYGILR